MSGNQRTRSNKAQNSLLLSFMERNPLFARGELDEDLCKDQWSELVENLNAIGGESRTVEVWKRTWNDKVRLAKDKKRDFESGQKNVTLNEVESQILKAIGQSVAPRRPSYEDSINSPSTSLPRTSLPSASYASPKPLKRSIDLAFQDEPTPHSSNKTFASVDGAVNIAKANNQIIMNLSNTLVECFQEQNKILKEGLHLIQKNISQMCLEVVQAFQLYKETPNKENTDDDDDVRRYVLDNIDNQEVTGEQVVDDDSYLLKNIQLAGIKYYLTPKRRNNTPTKLHRPYALTAHSGKHMFYFFE